MLKLCNDEMRELARFVSDETVPPIDLYVLPWVSQITAPDGETTYAMFDEGKKRIVMIDGAPESIKEQIFSEITRLYYEKKEEHLGEEHDEAAMEQFVEAMREHMSHYRLYRGLGHLMPSSMWQRFEYTTADQRQINELHEIVEKYGLTQRDLAVITRTIRLRPSNSLDEIPLG